MFDVVDCVGKNCFFATLLRTSVDTIEVIKACKMRDLPRNKTMCEDASCFGRLDVSNLKLLLPGHYVGVLSTATLIYRPSSGLGHMSKHTF